MSAMQAAEASGDGDLKSKDGSLPRIRRRNRMITSCLECRRRKLKCDKLQPCTNCSKFSRDCMFLAPALDSVSQKKLNELKEKMGSLERVLEDDIARRPTVRSEKVKGKRRPSNDLPGEDSNSDHEVPVPDDERRLEATPMAGFDAAYDDAGSEDILDVGIRIGKLRLTERIGGMFRPRLSEEVALQLGAPIRKDLTDPDVPVLPDHDDFVSPGSDYIAPGAGFMFGDAGHGRSLVDYLPTRASADTLVRQYHERCHIVAKVLYWPTFQLQYETFWNSVLSGVEPPASLQALVFAVLFTAVVSMKDESVVNVFGNSKPSIQASFQSATEVSLAKANFLRTTKVETLQAFVIYLIPLCREAVSRAHSVLAGTAVRLGECMGLHRDPVEQLGLMPVDAHVRRILWFQLCFLDYHTADKQGPRPSIKREEYDTQFPANINDSDLVSGKMLGHDSGWTDMTFTRLRFEICEMWRVNRVDIERLHMKKISLTHALGKIESFRRAMEAKYHPILDESIPIRRYARHVMTCQIHKMYIAVLHRYHFAVEKSIPDRLRQVILTNGVTTCEAAMEVHVDPELQEWSWYHGGMVGWPTAALLVLEIFTYPNRREADRIWTILDYVFQPDKNLSRDLKARQILSAIRDRTAFYRAVRGLRVPVSMQNRLDTTLPLRRIRVGGAEMLLPQSIISDKPKSEGSAAGATLDPSVVLSTSDMPHPRQAPPGGPIMQHPKTDAPVSDASWTFDHPYTLLSDRKSKPKSRTSSSSSPAAVQMSPSAASSIAPGLDTGHSPSGSSTNTESWPPPISSEQSGWRYAFSPSPQQVHANKARQMSQSHHSAPPNIQQNAMPAQAHQVYPFGSAAMASMPNMYISTDTSQQGQMPYVSDTVISPTTSSIAAMVGMNPHGGHVQYQDMQAHMAHGQMPVPNLAGNPTDAPMLDINWAEWDRIFPPEINHGHLDDPHA